MANTPQTTDAKNELVFLPLGGAGEVGMNLSLYGYGPEGDERWLIVDLGVTFGDGWPPGVDVLMPDPAFIEERVDALEGIVITHAHEDHLGAVQYLWERLRCPVYATPFTANILYRKLSEFRLENVVDVQVVPLSGKFSAGPFDIELITVTHSVPEPNAIALTTPLGTVLHTGDWKFDPGPVVGDATDEKRLRELGEDGVLAMICDSTNIFTPGTSGSEDSLSESLTELIGECEGRVAVACFASNVARLETVAKAAAANGRTVVLAGRSLKRIVSAARETGYLKDIPPFADEDDAGYLPADKSLIICTGSQGEPRAALARIANGDHPKVTLGAGDTVIFSAREIPGNELAIGRVQNGLVRRGVKVVTERERFVHVSGHPAQDELIQMYQHIRPRVAIPVHGERRHLEAHAQLARDCQVDTAVVAENGQMVRLAPGAGQVVDEVPCGRLALAGDRIVPANGELIRERIRQVFNGTALVTVALGANGLVEEPQITALGLVEEDDDPALGMAIDAAERAIDGLKARDLARDDVVEDAVRSAVRRAFRAELDKRPVTTVHLVRV